MGARGAHAIALWCVALICGQALSYTVDCNHDYTDCDGELSKISSEDDDSVSLASQKSISTTENNITVPQIANSNIDIMDKIETINIPTAEPATTSSDQLEDSVEMNKVPESMETKPKPRLLNINVDELQNFANALHNSTKKINDKKQMADLSDVNMDGDADDDDDFKTMPLENDSKNMPDKFYTNLQAPFHALINMAHGSEETDVCKENDITFKVGDKMDRGCEETCECTSGGVFECTSRCRYPYIRRGRRLNDPLCFESPVDDCCSIIACATGTGDTKVTKLEVCRHGNDTYTVGSKWHVGCEKTCFCEANSIVSCNPRCNPLPVSDKCINVQDPNDICCEMQVCDVSQDVHEEPENQTSSTSTTTEHQIMKSFQDYEDHIDSRSNRPLVLIEPIGSVKVLQNNSVQVNLMHPNNSQDPIHLLLSSDGGKSFDDVELKYSNMILNLAGGKDYILKTKETGTKFNFTITATDTGDNEVPNEEFSNNTNIGCYHDGRFYGVGEEFHLGCEQLCECTGQETRECAALVCPSHVGLELVSKGCVKWAPSPPAQPPNCCPRSARCLSDGTCHYKGVAVPNWSEVPLILTGCEERCFCENGELDCQQVCSPLPPVPPQHFRCPPNHRPAAVNISDEDCCKQWGCLPNAENEQTLQIYGMRDYNETTTHVTTATPAMFKEFSVLPAPFPTTDSIDVHNQQSSEIAYPSNSNIVQIYSNISPNYEYTERINGHEIQIQNPTQDDKHTVSNYLNDNKFNTLQDISAANFFTASVAPKSMDAHKISQVSSHYNLCIDKNGNDCKNTNNDIFKDQIESPKRTAIKSLQSSSEPIRKIPVSKIDHILFSPSYGYHRPISSNIYSQYSNENPNIIPNKAVERKPSLKDFFVPALSNQAFDISRQTNSQFQSSHNSLRELPVLGKQITVLKSKDIKSTKSTKMFKGELWNDETNANALTKYPGSHDTVLLRALSKPKLHLANKYNANPKVSQLTGKKYTALDLEQFIYQMEIDSMANKNMGRSTNNGDNNTEGKPSSETPSRPPFLPTVSPDIHFPDEDEGVRRPVNPIIEPPIGGLPPGFTLPPSLGDNNKMLSVINLLSDTPTSVKMLFGLPNLLVGLRGSVDLRYTDKDDEDISNWYSQVFAPADEVLTTPRLEFRLTGLKPSTTYKIRGKLYLHNLPVEPESEIYSIRTLDLPVEEKRREVDSRLTVTGVNDTTAHVTWKHFDEVELTYIDGIQVRYRPVGTPIYSMTELLHHSRSAADLHDLRPDTKYEASLVLVPPPKSTTELVDPLKVEFRTAPHVDPYNWNVTIETRSVGAGAAEVWWHGIPAPAERWVRVFRAAHACNPIGVTDRHDLHEIHGYPGHEMDLHNHDHDKYERDAFRLAARDLKPSITITGLLADTKCRIWLELFLTNGKVKTSNVLEINTKSLDHPEPIDNEVSSSSVAGRSGDYYGALVGVGAVAALGALSSLLLLLVVLRRHRPRSVAITTLPSAPRESSLPPYDNPAYKLELQQETMDL